MTPKLKITSVSRFLLSAIIFALFVIPIRFPTIATAQDEKSGPEARASVEPVSVEAYISHSIIAPGKELYLAIKLSIGPGWHVNSHNPNEDFLIPTEVSLGQGSPIKIEKLIYPDARSVKFEFSPDIPLSVYDDIVWIKVILSIDSDAAPGPIAIPIQVITQACDNRSCVAPTTQQLSIPLVIDPGVISPEIQHRSLFESFVTANGSKRPASPSGSIGQMPLSAAPQEKSFWSMVKNFKADIFIARYGYLLAFFAMYLLGLGLTLTPCVYPIIPITIGYFGSQAAGKMSRQFLMALIFGLGIAISYALVGTIAALSGSLLGAALQSSWVLIVLALICVFMGFNAFGAFEIVLPGWLMNMAGGGSRRGLTGAALMGLTMGIAAAPCLAAFIVSLLVFVGQKGDPILGFLMFFILGLGLATPFVALGTFSGLVSKAPKSGAWMVYAKKVMGALLFAAAFYFLNPVLPGPLYRSLVMVALVAAGLYFGFFEPTPATTWKFRAVRYLFAVVFIGIAIWWGMPDEGTTNISGIAWRPYSENALQKAKSEGRPVIIDIFADWCIPCKELDRFAFSDSRVVEASKNILMLKANITAGGSPETKKIIARFGVKGVPTVIFIRSDGEEEPELRINQLENADVVLERFITLLKCNGVQAKPLAGDNTGL